MENSKMVNKVGWLSFLGFAQKKWTLVQIWLHNMLDFRIACEKYLEVHGDAVKRIVDENTEKPGI